MPSRNPTHMLPYIYIYILKLVVSRGAERAQLKIGAWVKMKNNCFLLEFHYYNIILYINVIKQISGWQLENIIINVRRNRFKNTVNSAIFISRFKTARPSVFKMCIWTRSHPICTVELAFSNNYPNFDFFGNNSRNLPNSYLILVNTDSFLFFIFYFECFTSIPTA